MVFFCIETRQSKEKETSQTEGAEIIRQSEINNNMNEFCSVYFIRNTMKAVLQTERNISTNIDDVEASEIRAEPSWFMSLQLFDQHG
jgi:hypothetical protein